MDYLSYLPQFFIIVGLIFLILEIFLGIDTGFDLIILGSILLITGFSGNYFHSFSLSLFLIIILCLIYFILGRHFIKSKLSAFHLKTNTNKLLNQTGIVTHNISPNKPGLVKIDDEFWRATSNQILTTNTAIKVKDVSGVTLKVDPIN